MEILDNDEYDEDEFDPYEFELEDEIGEWDDGGEVFYADDDW